MRVIARRIKKKDAMDFFSMSLEDFERAQSIAMSNIETLQNIGIMFANGIYNCGKMTGSIRVGVK
jgi:hypothetical protein